MKVEASGVFPQSQQAVWEALMDFDLLGRTLPGVQKLTPVTPEGDAPSRRLVLQPGQVLFERGMTSDFVYVVDEGQIALVRERPGRSEEILRRAGPGEYFGELGPLLRRPRSATARAVSNAVVTRHGARNFKHLANRR